jgi:hypothetical protein
MSGWLGRPSWWAQSIAQRLMSRVGCQEWSRNETVQDDAKDRAVNPPTPSLRDRDLDGPDGLSLSTKPSRGAKGFLDLAIRPSVLSAPLGALVLTLAIKHFVGEPAMCDGSVLALPIAGAILGRLAWYCWSLMFTASAPSDI